MSTPPIDPDDERTTPPEPYVELLVRYRDDSEAVETIHLNPVVGDLAAPESSPKNGPEPSDGSHAA